MNYLENQYLKRQTDVLRGHEASIGERLQADLAAMQGLLAAPFGARDLHSGQGTSISVFDIATTIIQRQLLSAIVRFGLKALLTGLSLAVPLK